MENGNVREFIDNLTMQDEIVKYKDKTYYFYGIRYNEKSHKYVASIDRFGEDIFHFETPFFSYESESLSDCLEHLLDDKYWNGKSFWEVEKEMRWVDE